MERSEHKLFGRVNPALIFKKRYPLTHMRFYESALMSYIKRFIKLVLGKFADAEDNFKEAAKIYIATS